MSNSKNLPPSDKKLRKAREDGDVAKSRDLTGAFLLVIGFAYIFYSLPHFALLIDLMQISLSGTRDFHSNTMLVYINSVGNILFKLLILPLIVLFFAALLVETSQVGLRFSLKPLSFKAERFDLFKGLRRVFGFPTNNNGSALPTELFFNLAKIVLSMIIFGAVTAVILAAFTRVLVDWRYSELADLGSFLIGACAGLLGGFLPLYLSLGAGDLMVQRARRYKRLQMDFEELKRESRESDGDPETRGMRKQLHRELLANGVRQGVRRAKLVLLGRDC